VVNGLFCDGSVKSVKDTVNINPWWDLGTKSDSETISAVYY
jgi:hypothetical protein